MFKNDDIAKLILRLTLGLLMLFHGIAKLMHPESVTFIQNQLASHGLPNFLVYGVYIGEIVASLMIIFGVFTRWGGLLIVLNMIFAIFLVHLGDFFALTQHGGWRLELQAFYLFSGVCIYLFGSGKFAFKPD